MTPVGDMDWSKIALVEDTDDQIDVEAVAAEVSTYFTDLMEEKQAQLDALVKPDSVPSLLDLLDTKRGKVISRD